MKHKICIVLLLTILAISCLLLCSCHTHKFGEWKVTTEATCTTDGLQERVCECGQKDSKTIPATNHAFCEWIIDQEPRCDYKGSKHRHCECGQNSEREYIDALGHDMVQYDAKEPTCTESGWEAYESCSRCDITTYKEWPPMHTLDGNFCTVCNSEYVSAGLIYQLNADGTSYTVVGIEDNDAQIVIPATYNNKPVVAIGDRAFKNNYYVKYVYLPESITSIGVGAFSGFYIESITLPQGITNISDHTFDTCLRLKSISIPANVTSVGDYAFFGCKSLTSVTFEGNQVQSIGDSAFANCDNLANISLTNGLESIERTAFSGCYKLQTINIPQSVTNIGPSVFSGCSALIEIIVNVDNSNYKSIDGNLYSKDGTVLIQYSSGKTATSFDIPQSVTTIAERAFASSKLTNITIGGNITKIEGYAFAASMNLVHVTFTAPLEILGESVFYNCQNLESITLPSSLTTIGDYTFYNCNKLKNVNYCGSEEQWQAITKTEYWDYTVAQYTITYNYSAE